MHAPAVPRFDAKPFSRLAVLEAREGRQRVAGGVSLRTIATKAKRLEEPAESIIAGSTNAPGLFGCPPCLAPEPGLALGLPFDIIFRQQKLQFHVAGAMYRRIAKHNV